MPTAAAHPADLGWGIIMSTATEATPVGGVARAGGTAEADKPAYFGARPDGDAERRAVGVSTKADITAESGADRKNGEKQDKDPYIYGSDETILLDLRELRALEAAERAARDQAAASELDDYRGSHRRAAEAAELARQQEADTLLYADGGTAIPLARVREVCHDLRQPVAAIMMLASAAEMRPDVPDSVKAALQEITDQAEDISSAVRQFLDDAKRGVDGLGDPRPVNVAALARESIDRWRATYQGLLDFAAADDPLHVTIDPVLFRRALGNILSNATRAADVGGHVAVTVRKIRTERGARAVIEVDDSGPGFGNIPSGHGLGLAVVRRTAEAAGGSVEFAEGALGGALVRIVLPITAQQPLSLEDELAATFQGEVPLSALADIAGGEEIADGHVLATRFSAFPEPEQIAAAPLSAYATPVWAARGALQGADERKALAARAVSAPTVALSRAEPAAATAALGDGDVGEVRSAPTQALSRSELLAAVKRSAPTEAISRSELAVMNEALKAAAQDAAEAVTVSAAKPFDAFDAFAAPTQAISRHEPAAAATESGTPAHPAPAPASAAAQHANALRLPTRANLTMPTRIPVPAGVPQVATQLSLLPGGAF
jgi:signal transduction histidine kinase